MSNSQSSVSETGFTVTGQGDLSTIFKPNYSGQYITDVGYKAKNGQDLSEIFEPSYSSADQIGYDTGYKVNGVDLNQKFMNITYKPVNLTASGFNTALSIFKNSSSGGTQTITDLNGMIVYSGITGSLTVTNFPTNSSLYALVIGGGAGGGGGGGAWDQYSAGAGGGWRSRILFYFSNNNQF